MESEDDHLEQRLRDLRPIGPAPALRARVLMTAHTRPRGSSWLWLPAAAALFASVFVAWRTAREYEALGPSTLIVSGTEHQRAVDRLSREWGGTTASHAAAAAAIDAIEGAARRHRYVVSGEGSIK